MCQINTRNVSELHDATRVINATQVVDQSNDVNAGEMINRGDKAKANDNQGKRKIPDSQCTSLSMPRKRVSLVNYPFLYMCLCCLCVFVNTSIFKLYNNPYFSFSSHLKPIYFIFM